MQANRSLLWLKPDHIIIYDRATSQSAGLFKRFNLCLPAAPAVSALKGGGSLLTETLADGQQLFISSLLPANGTASINSLSNVVTTVAEGEPCQYRLTIENTNNPADIRFLHVLQGADAGMGADAVTYCQSGGGNLFEGVAVRGVAVLVSRQRVEQRFYQHELPGAGRRKQPLCGRPDTQHQIRRDGAGQCGTMAGHRRPRRQGDGGQRRVARLR